MRTFLFNILLFVSLSAFSQRIQDFHLLEANSNVAVKFAIGKGSQCGGYKIWHSSDSVNFNEVYNYPGVCGDVNVTQNHSFTHSTPVANGYNYYKVELLNTEVSPVKSIYVSVPPDDNILIYPTPVTNINEVLHFKINSNGILNGYIYNQFGKPVKKLSLVTDSYKASTYINDLDNGVYLVRLNDGHRTFSSKFIINR